MNRPIFCISDLHLGDGGPRDNFAHASGGRREAEFLSFLDYVEDCKGELFIVGDLFELWQGNVSAVMTHRMPLLNRLAKMGATYVLGNHDVDLRHFGWKSMIRLSHPLLRTLGTKAQLIVNGARILLIHGHEQDEYCASDVPGIGRASAIYTGLKEDRNGGPFLGEGSAATVESATLGRLGWVNKIYRRLTGKPSHAMEMRRAVYQHWLSGDCDVLIYGHTHEPGTFRESEPWGDVPIYNCGSWCGLTNSFVCIDPNGDINVWDWVLASPRLNNTKLLLA